MLDPISASLQGLSLTELLAIAPPCTRLCKVDTFQLDDECYYRALFMYEGTWQEVKGMDPTSALRGLLWNLANKGLWVIPKRSG